MSGPPGWQVWADVTLQHEALLWRAAGGVPPRPTAGVLIDEADADRLLASLPGVRGVPAARKAEIDDWTASSRAAAEEAWTAALADDSRWAGLVRSVGLGDRAARALALMVAVELDPGRQQLVAYLNDDVRCPRLTLALLARLGYAPEAAPGAPLVRAALVEPDPAGTWAMRQIAVPARVCWHLLGVDDPDPDLPAATRVLGPEVAGLLEPEPRPGAEVHIVAGGDRYSRLLRIRRVTAGAPCLVTGLASTAEARRALVREAVLRGAGVVLEIDAPPTAEDRALIEQSPIWWGLSSPTELPLAALPERPWTEQRLAEERASEDDWHRALGAAYIPDHPLDHEQLRLVARAIHRDGPIEAQADPGGAVRRGVRRLAAGHLDRHALRIVPRFEWGDLVLPADQRAQLRELTARYRHRHTVFGPWGFRQDAGGILALFAGPSGTGKTMAAEIIAGDLGLDLYRVDLSGVVSKYIGETEKNLGEIFDAARATAAVLLFDEADALFGKRTEVSDAHDRYANIEVSYLLQRLEAFDGCVVLTTNLRRNIDQAFTRRLTATVEFPAPDLDQRRAIWQANLPTSAPVEGIDVDFLAERFSVTGGMIRNVAVAAAFLAAEADRPIGMVDLIRAMKRELQKAGRLRTEADFGPYYHLVTGEGS